MGSPSVFVEDLEAGSHSGDSAVRARAMQGFLNLVRRDPSVINTALPIFRHAIAHETDPWTAHMAARGIGVLLGADHGREARRLLLRREHPGVAAHAALEVSDPVLVPELLELFARSSDHHVRISVLRTFGRLRDPRGYPILLEGLKVPEWRFDVIESLADFGDPRAIGLLESFENDSTVLDREDERGATVVLADVARAAVRRLRQQANAFQPGTAGNPLLPLPRTAGPARATLRWWQYLPLALAAFEMPWALLIVFVRGSMENDAVVPRIHGFDLITCSPAILGLLSGLAILLSRRLSGRSAYAPLVLGCLGCAAFVYVLGSEFVAQ